MSHVDTLRTELQRAAEAEQALSDLRTELAELCGYYLDREGVVPVCEIRALLDGAR